MVELIYLTVTAGSYNPFHSDELSLTFWNNKNGFVILYFTASQVEISFYIVLSVKIVFILANSSYLDELGLHCLPKYWFMGILKVCFKCIYIKHSRTPNRDFCCFFPMWDIFYLTYTHQPVGKIKKRTVPRWLHVIVMLKLRHLVASQRIQDLLEVFFYVFPIQKRTHY